MNRSILNKHTIILYSICQQSTKHTTPFYSICKLWSMSTIRTIIFYPVNCDNEFTLNESTLINNKNKRSHERQSKYSLSSSSTTSSEYINNNNIIWVHHHHHHQHQQHHHHILNDLHFSLKCTSLDHSLRHSQSVHSLHNLVVSTWIRYKTTFSHPYIQHTLHSTLVQCF